MLDIIIHLSKIIKNGINLMMTILIKSTTIKLNKKDLVDSKNKISLKCKNSKMLIFYFIKDNLHNH